MTLEITDSPNKWENDEGLINKTVSISFTQMKKVLPKPLVRKILLFAIEHPVVNAFRKEMDTSIKILENYINLKTFIYYWQQDHEQETDASLFPFIMMEIKRVIKDKKKVSHYTNVQYMHEDGDEYIICIDCKINLCDTPYDISCLECMYNIRYPLKKM